VTGSTAAPTEPPAAVLARAQAEGLGAYHGSFAAKKPSIFYLIFMTLFGILTAVFIIGFVALWQVFQSPKVNRKRASMRLHFFGYGLILADSTGPTGVYRWGEITVLQAITKHYTNGIYIRTTYVYTLTKPDGTRTKITEFYENPQVWGPAIQNAVTGAQLPVALAALRAGNVCRFGDLSINRGGISSTRSSVTWDEIDEITVAQGYVRVRKAGKWISWSAQPVRKIPNFIVFLAAAEQMRTEHRQLTGRGGAPRQS